MISDLSSTGQDLRINSRVLLFRRRRGDEPAELNGELFTLERFPPNAEEEALQAWEAADEYLLQQVNDVDGLTLIFNDGFGALACALAERNPVSINDSFISELATRHNLRMNGIDEENVRFQDSLSPLPAAPALVLIKVPNSWRCWNSSCAPCAK